MLLILNQEHPYEAAHKPGRSSWHPFITNSTPLTISLDVLNDASNPPSHGQKITW
jgi:hypothetical protein